MDKKARTEFVVFLIISIIAVTGMLWLYNSSVSGSLVTNYREGMPETPKYQMTMATEYCNVIEADLGVSEEECLSKGLMQCEQYNSIPGQIATCLKECNRDIIRQCAKALGKKGISIAPPLYEAGVRYQPR